MMNTNQYNGRLQSLSLRKSWAVVSSALLLCSATLVSTHAYANGEISFVGGKAQIISSAKEARTAGKGARIVPGETLQTGSDGEIHAIMDDNTVIAIRANSSLKIEDYVANGDEKDRSVLFLLRGQLRSITGWIGKIAPKNYAIRTPAATIGIRGTDHEVAVIENGDGAGTYDKVNFGETVMKTPKGDVPIPVGKSGFAKKGAEQAPAVLAVVPSFYKPTPNEDLIEKEKEKAAKTADERLKKKQDEVRRKGGVNAKGNTRITDACTNDPSAMNAFNEFLRAYELGNTGLIRNRMDPSMVGYQNFIDGIIQDTNRLKQMRVFLKDTQLQCGPDLTVIQTLWEKRYLDVNTFAAGLLTGRATILMHRDQGTWKFVAVSGDNPFGTVSNVPALFSFTSPAAQAQSTVVTSTPSTLITGLAGSAAISIVGGTYSINGGAFTSAAGIIKNNQAVAVRTTSSASPGGVVVATVTIGGVSGSFTVTTMGSTVPSAFSFPAPAAVAPSTIVTSTPATTITGLGAPSPISVVGGTYSINGGAFTAAPGSITNNQTVAVRVTSSGTASGVVVATVTIGGVPGSFTVTTLGSTIPSAFSFASPAVVAPSTIVTSTPVTTITGLGAPSPISIVGGAYSINGGAFTSAAGTITNNQTVAVRVTSSGAVNGVVIATVTIGGVSGSFTVTTYDNVPNAYGPFANQTVFYATPCPLATSPTTVTITGINTPTPISIANMGGATQAAYSINSGAFTSTAGNVNNGDTVNVRADVPFGASTGPFLLRATLTVGGVSQNFSAKCY